MQQNESAEGRRTVAQETYKWLRRMHIKAFYDSVTARSFADGAKALIQVLRGCLQFQAVLSVCLPVSMSAHLSVCLSFMLVYMCVSLLTYLSVCLPLCLSVSLSMCLCFCLPACLSAYLSI